MQIAKTNARIAEQQKRSAKNARHKANRKKRNALVEVRKLKEVEKLKEKKKQTFIDFIISRTLYDDSDWYDGSPCKYDMPSAYELAIMLGSHFHWVIMDYDNFTMPDPRVLNQDRIFFGGKEYWYRLTKLPCMNYLLNMAIRYSCNHIIIERLLKLGASPNKAPFNWRTINIKLKEQFEEEKLKREKQDEISRKRTEIQDYDDEYDDSYYDDYDYYDNDYDNTSYTRYEESHQEYQLIPPICVAAINGMIDVVKVLLKYGANVTECVIEYIPSRYNSYEGRYILMKYNAVDYARHSFDSECIKLIKSGYDKIQSDEMSLLQCLSATRNNKSNCTYIPGIYRHIKKFLKPISDRDTYQEYHTYNTYGTYLDWRNFPIYSKSGLHIYKSNGWTINSTPIFESLRDMKSYSSGTFRYFYDTSNITDDYKIKKLPHMSTIGGDDFATIDDSHPDRLLIDIQRELGFINMHYNRVCKCDNYHNDDCECYNYQTYVDFKVTRDNITISCKFAGDTESQRISNMADYYLTKYKMAINTDIFGVYVRKL